MASEEHYNVAVVGGGTAGVVAAIQAGRAGAKTLLVEKTGVLGGTMTNGGINFPGLFHAWGKQVISGIGWELVTRCVKESGGTLPDFSDYNRHHAALQVRINPFIYAALCDQSLVDAGVKILFHTMLAGLSQPDSGPAWKLSLCTKTGIRSLTADIIIDTTGDANAAALAGLPISVPEVNQPATLSCRASGYDLDELNIDEINKAFSDEVKAGRLCITDAGWNTEKPNVGHWLRAHGNNASHVHHINARSSEGKAKLEMEARAGLLRLYRFLRRQPGLEGLTIDYVCPECGVRETATIEGVRKICVEDYKTGRIWDDAVCYAFYPIDLHRSDGDGLGK